MRIKPAVHVLLLGCGRAAEMHSGNLRRMGGVALSYASRDGERAARMCRRFEGRRAFGSYESALGDSSVDVVLIATPTASHCELALRALEARHDVIVEKPAFMSSRECDVVIEAEASAGRTVMVAENYFYKPIAAYLRDVVRSGELGEITKVSLDARKQQKIEGWRANPAMSGGGALFEGGVHWISFAANIGLDVAGVEATVTGGTIGNDTSSIVRFVYAGGATGTLLHSWDDPAPLGHIRFSRVDGTAGSVVFESNGLAHYTRGRSRSVGVHMMRDPFGYRTMLEDFLDAVRDRRQPQFTLAMARRDIELLEEASRTEASPAAHDESARCTTAR